MSSADGDTPGGCWLSPAAGNCGDGIWSGLPEESRLLGLLVAAAGLPALPLGGKQAHPPVSWGSEEAEWWVSLSDLVSGAWTWVPGSIPARTLSSPHPSLHRPASSALFAALCPPARLGPLLGAPRPTTASTLTSVRPDAAPEVTHIHVPTVGKCQRLAINMKRKPPLEGRAWYSPCWRECRGERSLGRVVGEVPTWEVGPGVRRE